MKSDPKSVKCQHFNSLSYISTVPSRSKNSDLLENYHKILIDKIAKFISENFVTKIWPYKMNLHQMYTVQVQYMAINYAVQI